MGGWAETKTNQTRAHARHLHLELEGKDGTMGWDNDKPNKSTRPTLTTMSYRGRMGGWAGTKTNKKEHTPDTYNYELQGKDGRMGWDNKTKQEHTPDTYNYELQGKDGRMGWDNNKPNRSTRPTLTTMSYRGRMGGWAGTMTNQTRAHARHLQL